MTSWTDGSAGALAQSSSVEAQSAHIVSLNVGGVRFATSNHTLTWIPETFFTSMLSGRVPTVRDDSGAIFIDRDPDMFRVILNYLRTKQVDLSSISVAALKHEAQFFGLAPLVRRLTLCEELDTSGCGSVLFHGIIPTPAISLVPAKERCLSEEKQSSRDSPVVAGTQSSTTSPACNSSLIGHGYSSPVHSPRTYGHCKKGSMEWNRSIRNEIAHLRQQYRAVDDDSDQIRVRMIRGNWNLLAVAYSYSVYVYRMHEALGWETVYSTNRMESPIRQLAINAKFGAQGNERVLAVALGNLNIHLWVLEEQSTATRKGKFTLGVSVDKLFFIGSQMVALSKIGKVGIWQSTTNTWQVQTVSAISCYDTAGSSLLLGCTNGSMYYIDMQKFPLRMKDNDLLVTELYRDPSGYPITAISVYLTPKTTVCGNWIEIAYGTSSGCVRVIVQHPETVGHGPQLFQTYNVHNSPVTRVNLNTTHLISVCSEYNHVRSWLITRFRGMISTQPGSTSLASFKVLTLESTEETTDKDYTDIGPCGDPDGEQIFVQRVVPDANQLFVRLASTGERLCTIRTVDGAPISAFNVHECEGSSRMGSRPRRFIFLGTTTGAVQVWDLTTALEQYQMFRTQNTQSMHMQTVHSQHLGAQPDQAPGKPAVAVRTPKSIQQVLSGPSPQELLHLIDECDICCNSITPTPTWTPYDSVVNLSGLTLDQSKQ